MRLAEVVQGGGNLELGRVRCTHKSGLWIDLTFATAVAEIARETSVEQFDSRMGIAAALCAGEVVVVGVHTYEVRP